ncbi:hypothetical protein [Flavobacterium sp. 140616W15]|uniref:hypothetical protein n=1 Tax=Flavobacterium sp. 140616W15 TaxID=2478552 RepID=UPI000F0CFEE4|nr:hypothetical protein [Flavobacterium sp. 140616W15]AYN05773.1 hypothetical protein EAG11_17660 [Flavobacterium sp. 140616W15]
MKKIILLLSLFCLLVGCKTKKITKLTRLEAKSSNLDFNRSVKKVILTHYSINDSTEIISDKKPLFVQIQTFDVLGNLTGNKVTHQDKSNNIDAEYIFDASNKVTSSKFSYNTLQINSIYKHQYKGKKLLNSEEYNQDTNSLEAVTKYKYNAKKLKSIEHLIKKDSSLQIIETTLLSSSGIIKEVIKYDNSKISKRDLYDSIGRIMISYSGPTNKVLYTYDKHGNIATEKDNAYSFKYEYDSYGNETVRYLFDSDLVFCPTGDFIIGIRYHVYEYDKKKNWIKKIEFDRQCIPKTIEIRTLEYY